MGDWYTHWYCCSYPPPREKQLYSGRYELKVSTIPVWQIDLLVCPFSRILKYGETSSIINDEMINHVDYHHHLRVNYMSIIYVAMINQRLQSCLH